MANTRRIALTAALAIAVLTAGCSATHDPTDSSKPLDTASAVAPDASTAASAATGLPLDQIDNDRPRNSGLQKTPSMKVFKAQGGICTVRGAKADCANVPLSYRADADRLWQRTLRFFPPPVRAPMTEFVLLPRGQGGGVADDARGNYVFSLAFPTSGDIDHIIIHELGHAFEVTTHRDFGKSWRKRFWSAADTKLANKFVAKDNPTQAANPLYQAKPDSFVHPYGATSASEDFAETFRWFVLGVKPEGHTVKEQKILSMWDVPELVAARAHIQQQQAAHPGPITPDPH